MDTKQSLMRQLPFIVITLLFVTVSFLDRLLPEGMFFDGVIYATVARNEAIGKGSFWLPYYGHGSNFWEHPPLMFGIQSWLFRIFGDEYFVEKIYCFIVWAVTVYFISRLWKLDRPEGERKYMFWLPLLMWGITSTILWAYPNNILECTMGLFDIAAILCLYRAMDNRRHADVYVIFAGAFVVLAALVKGPVGLFPMALPAIHWLVYRKQSIGYAIDKSVFLFLTVTFLILALFSFETSRYVLSNYLDDQLFNSLAGKREQVESSLGRFELIVFLFTELLPAIIFTIVLVAVGLLLKIKPGKEFSRERRDAIFFLLVGVSGSLPIMVSIKQRSFYLVPSIPFFVIGLALLAYPFVSGMVKKYTLSPAKTRYLNIALLIACVASIPYLFSKVNTIGREKELINDIKLIDNVLPAADTIGICSEMNFDFPFLAYAARYSKVEVKVARLSRDVIVNREMCAQAYVDSIISRGYKKIDIPTMKYDVYKNKMIFNPSRVLSH